MKKIYITDVLYKTVIYKGVTLYVTSCLPQRLRHLYALIGSAIQSKTAKSYFPFVCVVAHKSSLARLEQAGFDADAFLAGKEGRV